MSQKSYIHLILMIAMFSNVKLFAACGSTSSTWAGTNTNWTTASNWDNNNNPDSSTEDAVIISNGFEARLNTDGINVACVDVQSGSLRCDANRTLTIHGDYFRALSANTLNIRNNSCEFELAGTGPQEFEVVDDIRDLNINNSNGVTLKGTFRIRSDFFINSSGTTTIDGDITLQNANIVQTIPVGHKFVIKDGASLFARGGLNIEGELEIEPGGELRIRRNETLTVANGGVLKLLGASGNPAKLVSEASNRTFVFNMNGTLTADFFLIQRPDVSGINVSSTGTITEFSNGELRGVADNGYFLTLASGATIPATADSIGFYNDNTVANPGNVDASAYSGSSIEFSNFVGDFGDDTYENDPNNVIDWSASSVTELTVANTGENGEPQTFADPGDTFTYGEFQFALTQDDTATNITSITFTMSGTGSMSDFDNVIVQEDSNGNCERNNSDAQLGSALVFTGTPPQATVTIPSGTLTTSGPSDPACIFIRAETASNPVDGNSLKFEISVETDIVNDQGYAFSATSGLPVASNASVVRNNNFSEWEGSTSTSWSDNSNWNGGLPSSTRDCNVGAGASVAQIDANPVSCANATLQTGGEINWNSTSNSLDVYGSLDVDATYTFSNATSGKISMVGTSNQNMSILTAFPGNVDINNTGTDPSNVVTVTGSSTINGDLTCIEGVVSIPNLATLTVLGDITVQTGCEINISEGGTLQLGDGSTLTVNSGGKLSIVGSSGSNATITSDLVTSSYEVVINGDIDAEYFTFSNLGTNGLSIESGATISSTYHLNYGSFIYPVNSGSTLLQLKTQIPGNEINSITFDTNSSGAAGLTNIDTTGAAAGTLNILSYTGDFAGASFDNDPTYGVSWSGAATEILLTAESTSPTPLTTGNVYNMGRFGLQQKDAGASFSDSEITSIKLSLVGTGNNGDISEVKLHWDANCDDVSDELIGVGTLSGSPASVTFTPSAGTMIVPADASSPDKVCFYVQYEIASDATDGNTVGVEISMSSDIVDDQGYGISTTTPAPINSGTSSTIDAPTTTTWTGDTDTDWTDASNWSAGVPDSATSCEIPNVANDPIITSGTVTCKDVDIPSGILTINNGATLEFYGNFTNTGTLIANGNIQVSDGGAPLNHTINSDDDFGTFILNKTGFGFVNMNSDNLTIDTITLAEDNFYIRIPSGKTLTLPNGLNLSAGSLYIRDSATLEIGNGQDLTVSGGSLFITGTNDSFPQSQAAKGVITAQGGGSNTWGFNATSGSISLVGFQLDRLDNDGLNISGTTTVSAINGGQLTNLSSSYSSMTGIQLNTSGSIPASFTNIAWVWGDFNSFDPANTNTPSESDGYTLISSTGCGSQSVDITGWTGDFYESQNTFDTTTKVSASGCTINLAGSASSVALLSFTATGYDGEVDVKWETNVENNHLGFNVYRSDADANNFVQLNTEIIRNLNNYGSRRGKYQFIDNDVTNGETYYYYIEDIDTNAVATLHGPQNATPESGLGSAVALADHNQASKKDNTDDSGDDAGTTINNPSYKDLGDGVIIHSQTSDTIRIEITPTAPTFNASTWDGNYDTVDIEGYSKITDSTYPELPVRVLLIDVYPYATEAAIINQTISTSTISSRLIAPVPTFTQNGSGGLDTSYSIDTTTYSTNDYYIDNHINVETDLIANGDKKFLKVTIHPLRHNPVTEELIFSDSILIDIGFDGNDWAVDVPSDSESFTNMANILRIDFIKSGMYELTYDEIDETNQVEPFKDLDLSEFRLYFKDAEIAMEIEDGDGVFNSGDKLRFYLEHTETLEDVKNRAFLSPIALKDESDSPLRMDSYDGDPTDEEEASENYYYQEKTYEENWTYIDGVNLGDNLDHFFWHALESYDGANTLSFSATLDGIDTESDENVLVDVHYAAVEGYRGGNFDHHLEFYIDGTLEEDFVFSELGRDVKRFEIPANLFDGATTITLKVPGTYSAAYSDYDRIMLNKVVFTYTGYNSTSDVKMSTFDETEVTHTFSNFSSSNIKAYDVTDPYEPVIITNGNITTPDAGSTYDIEFYVDEEVNDEGYKKVAVFENNSFYNPSNISLNPGGRTSLKLGTNRADLLIIGAQDLLTAASDLRIQRESQGMEVALITPDQIYNEFSHGSQSTEAIREFISYALDYWENKPEYVLILGDGTVDPLDHDVDELDAEERSATYSSTLPSPLIEGRFLIFSGDNFFVTDGESATPRVSIGRIPTNDTQKLEKYIDKIISYENGDTVPTNNKASIFLSGEDQDDYDDFDSKTNELAQLPYTYPSNGFTSAIYDYNDYGSGATFKTAIKDAIDNNTPLLLNYIGHGASNLWGSSSFTVDDVDSLSNSEFPIILTWNCEAAYYMDFNNTYISLGEEFILAEEKGAIAFIGSTAQTTPTAQMTLAKNFYQVFASATNSHYQGYRLGDALHAAKLKTGSNVYERDAINSFSIIGDPSIKIPEEIFAPTPEAYSPRSGGGGGSLGQIAGGGCSVIGAENALYSNENWYFGLMEWLIYIMFFALVVFTKNRVYNIITKKD